MIPHTKLFREAVRYPTGITSKVDVLVGNKVVLGDVNVVDGSWDADYNRNNRLNCDLVLAVTPTDLAKISINTCRVRLQTGITTLGYTEMLTLGTFRVDDLDQDNSYQVKLSCSGLEAYIIDARFPFPRTPPYGVSTIEAIKSLIREVLPSHPVIVETTSDKRVLMRAPWQRERWDAVQALASSIGAQVFVDHRGAFIIRKIPALIGGTPIIEINSGASGVLINSTTKQTRDRVYNGVSVSGQSSDPKRAPARGWAFDKNPASETYYFGPFGQVPRFYSSQFITTNSQAQATAQRMLNDAKAANHSLSCTSTQLVFLEVEDRARFTKPNGATEVHMISKLSGDLGVGGQMKLDTISSKQQEVESA